MSQQRKMPTLDAIAAAWCFWLVENKSFDGIRDVMEVASNESGVKQRICFACGWFNELERAHIDARCEGGNDHVANLHLLCHQCHKTSELLQGDDYFSWFLARKQMDVVWELAVNGPGGITAMRTMRPE